MEFISQTNWIEIKQFMMNYSLALTALAVIIYTTIIRKITAFNTVVFLAVILSVIHQHIAAQLVPTFSWPEYNNGSEIYPGLTFHHAVLISWYFSFAITDVLFYVASMSLIKRFELVRDRVSTLVLYCHLVLAAFQVIHYANKVLKLKVFDPIYQNGVVMINSFMVVMICIMAMRVVVVATSRVSLSKGAV